MYRCMLETASTDEALDADTRDLAARVAECKAKQYRGGTRAEDMMEPLLCGDTASLAET